jgi:cell cycle arrest protein BUB3
MYNLTPDTLVSGSFDRTLRIWDPRSSTPSTATHTLPERVYHMDVTGTTVVVGMAGRLFHIYDVRKIREGGEPLQRRESSMKFMTHAVACMSDGKGKLCPVIKVPTSEVRVMHYYNALLIV